MGKLDTPSRIKLGIAALCFVLAGLVWALTRGSSGSLQDVPEGDLTWTLCLSCGYTEQMPVRNFFTEQQQEMLQTHNMMTPPMITCPRCGKKQMVRALKCERCGTIFAVDSVPGDYYDRCPKCGYSALESRHANTTANP